ncbi:MAG: DNA polymerase III subunit gamma/tau [Bacteroidota bacterium]
MSKFVVSARKYRPMRFDDVVGQQHVSQTLKNALQNDHLAHAFLFCGPRGVGKTTCARILAKVLNCQNRTQDFEPCNTCNSCEGFNENASFNITELDAASNNSVDHIRALVEQVRFQPQQGEYKVFIIDEVHMLSQAAFNAFLKTLEEPPSYAIFILATTEKHKIIPTILSRCQIFDFKRIQVPMMVEHLQNICNEEGIEADKDALHIVAQKADGALRDALSIFDRIVSSTGKQITYADVITNLNVLDYDYFFRVTDAMLVEDLAQVYLLFNQIKNNGFEPDLFINGYAEHLRNLLVCKDERTLKLLEVSDKVKEKYHTQAHMAPTSFLLAALNIANDCDVNYKMARNKSLHVEMALTKMTYINRATTLAQNPPIIVEKKTPDTPPSTTAVTSTAMPQTPSATSPTPAVADTPPTPPHAIVPTAKPNIPETTVEKNTAEPAAKSNGKLSLPSSSKYNLGKIPTKEELQNQVVKEVAENDAKVSQLNQENLEKTWLTYTEAISSPSVKSVFKNASVSVTEADTIQILVGSNMAEGMVRQEYGLTEFLRNHLHHPKLVLDIKIDPTKIKMDEKPKPKVLSSPKDKYDKMMEINPLVEELRKRFDLKMDKR